MSMINHPNRSKRLRNFLASYESAAKAEASAKGEGWKEGEDGFLDYIDPLDDRLREHQKDLTEAQAVAWIKAAVLAGKTLFGAGDVREIEFVPANARCQYCICNGWREVRRLVVTNDGVESDEPTADDCHSDGDE